MRASTLKATVSSESIALPLGHPAMPFPLRRLKPLPRSRATVSARDRDDGRAGLLQDVVGVNARAVALGKALARFLSQGRGHLRRASHGTSLPEPFATTVRCAGLTS